MTDYEVIMLLGQLQGKYEFNSDYNRALAIAIKALEAEPTKEERRLLDKWRDNRGVSMKDFEEAMNALEAEPCEDAISRADAEALFRNARKELMEQDRKEPIKDFHTRDLMLLNAEQMIHLLPCVTPARPKGKWIPIKADCRGYTFTFECSECHGYSYEDIYTIECEYDWCPRCGADMKGGEEDGKG